MQRLFVSRAARACLTAAVVLLGVRQASAAQILQFRNFSGTAFDAVHVDPFDGTLGTLDSIDVDISGSLTVVGITGQQMIPVGNLLSPIPYNYQLDVTQTFQGLANQFFHFNGPATFNLPGIASGGGEAFAMSTSFSYTFTLNAFSDLAGFTVPVTSSSAGVLIPPAAGVTGLRSHFVDGFSPLEEIDFFQTQATVAAFGALTSPFVIANTSTNGLLQITYDYTPAPVVAAVPEPGTITLVGAGLAALARRRKKDVA